MSPPPLRPSLPRPPRAGAPAGGALHRARLAVAALCLALSGCVVIPHEATYYRPNPADGTPEATPQCGHWQSHKDMLARPLGGAKIEVASSYHAGGELTLRMYVESPGPGQQWDLARVALYADGQRMEPVSIRVSPRTSDGILFAEYRYAPTAAGQQIALTPEPGFLRGADGSPLAVAPFRFERVKGLVVEVGAINC